MRAWQRIDEALFLTGTGCRFWCAVAGLDCEVVRQTRETTSCWRFCFDN